MSELDVTLALRALGRRLDAEPVPDLAPVVLARLGDVAAPRRRWRPLVLAIAVLLLAAAVAVAASDRVRDFLFGAGVVRRARRDAPGRDDRARPDRHRARTDHCAAPAGRPGGVRVARARSAGRGGGRGRRARHPACRSPISSARRTRSSAPRRPTARRSRSRGQPADPVLLTVVPAHDENDPFLIGKELTQQTTAEFVQLAGRRRGAFHLRRTARRDAVRRPPGAVPARRGRAAVAPVGDGSRLPAGGPLRPGSGPCAGDVAALAAGGAGANR